MTLPTDAAPAVDVLAVMDRMNAEYRSANGLIDPNTHDARSVEQHNARALVANLIDAATAASGIVRISGLHCLRLDAALAAATNNKGV